MKLSRADRADLSPCPLMTQSGHWRVEIPQRSSLLPHRGVQSLLLEAPEAPGDNATAPIHRITRRRGCMAASGACAATGAHAAHRRAHDYERRRSGRAGRITAFVQGLQHLGWTDRGNVRIDTRWSAGNPNEIRKYVTEFVALAPDVNQLERSFIRPRTYPVCYLRPC
jgi:hypothetical protein